MVKIRLRRMGNKHRPFYRIVVAKSMSGRDGSFIENLGTYNPLTKPSTVVLNGERALHWLMTGAQPTETVAYLLKREGVLEKFFAERPKAKASYKFLDKTTSAMSQKSVVATPAAEEAPAAVAVAEKPEEVPAVEAEPAVEETAPVEASAEEAPAEEEKAD